MVFACDLVWLLVFECCFVVLGWMCFGVFVWFCLLIFVWTAVCYSFVFVFGCVLSGVDLFVFSWWFDNSVVSILLRDNQLRFDCSFIYLFVFIWLVGVFVLVCVFGWFGWFWVCCDCCAFVVCLVFAICGVVMFGFRLVWVVF